MLRVLQTAAITARMLVTTTMISPFTAAAQKADKSRKIKNKEKRETSPESLSSDSENSSSSEDSFDEGNSAKSHRFQIISKYESHKWELSGEMEDYVNHQFEFFIPEKDVESCHTRARP